MSGSPTPGLKAAQDTEPARCRFGDLWIDTGRQRVTRGEHAIALPKLSYDLLLALVRAAPNLVSLDSLMEQVWPKAVVSPETVSQRIKLLRDALGDDPRAPRYIEGLRGRGYRLIPSVDYEAAATQESSQAAAAIGAPPRVAVPPPPKAAGTSAVGLNATPGEAGVPVTPAAPQPLRSPRAGRRPLMRWIGVIAGSVLSGLVVFIVVRQRMSLEPLKPRTSVEVVAIQPRTVAVLPFDNLSAEPNNDYIALGIADSVLHQLASSSELIVISRSSSFALGKPVPEPREAGRRLGVRYLVSGSVQRADKVLRVTAQLTDTSTNVELWSLKVDRTIDEVFALQDQIAQRVAQQLDATMQSRSAEYARYGTDAYLAFLKGRALIESRKLKDVEAAIQQFSRAVELAPTFAAAMAELARAKEQLATLLRDADARSASLSAESEALVDRAIEIDPSAGEPYFKRARRKLDGKDARGAEADFRKGLELAPNFGPGLRDYAVYLNDQGRVDEALEQLDRARLVEPLSAENHYRKGEMLRFLAIYREGNGPRGGSRGLEDAAALYLQALSVQPEFYPAYTRLAQVRWSQGRLAEAIKYAEKSVAVEPAVGWTRYRLVWFYLDSGDLRAARDVLRGYAPGAAVMATTEALVCYRAGNLERAEAILRSIVRDPDASEDGFAVMVAPAAIIERAIASHDPTAARQFITTIPWLKKTRGSIEVVDDNFPWIVQLATLEHAVGSQAVANDLAQRILRYLDPNGGVHNRQIPGGWDEWARAAASAILGRSDAALAHLQNLLQWDLHIGWWARIERDPTFATLRSTPRFQAILSGSRLWLQGEVRQVELMRSRGEVPPRSSEQLSPRGC